MDPSDYISNGLLPPAELVNALIVDAHARYRTNEEGANADVYPTLALARRDAFGICVAATTGAIFSTGDAGEEFSIMSVSKPFVFALVCDALGPDRTRRAIGVNGTGCRSTRSKRCSAAPMDGRIRWSTRVRSPPRASSPVQTCKRGGWPSTGAFRASPAASWWSMRRCTARRLRRTSATGPSPSCSRAQARFTATRRRPSSSTRGNAA